jgi:hypothetical protein
MKFLKMFRLFLLGTVFLIRTASEKMFLIRTDHVKYIEKQNSLLNGLFLYLNLKISFCVRIEKCSLTDGTLTSSDWSQTDFSYDVSNDIKVCVEWLICHCRSNQRFCIQFWSNRSKFSIFSWKKQKKTSFEFIFPSERKPAFMALF